MPDGIFGTTKLRRFWTFIGLWALAIVSIMYYITTPLTDGVLSLLQIGGRYYYNSQIALNEFAQAATVPEQVVLLVYGILALILLMITIVILVTRVGSIHIENVNTRVISLTITSILVVISAVVISTIMSGSTFVFDLFNLVLQITPPILSLSPVAVAIAIITSYVP
jgi:hypothetical protein